MEKYLIEVSDEMDGILRDNAKLSGNSVEKIIYDILKRYLIPANIMERETVKQGYEEMGAVNLEWSNLK